MYKCTECGLEYKIKPDYCDCGNNVFNNITQSKTIPDDSILKKNLPSVIFLVFCIILSFIILFFIGNPKDEPVKNKTQIAENKTKIADIDDIWNDEKPKQVIYRAPQAPKNIDKEFKIIQKEQENEIQKKEQKPTVKKQPQIVSIPKQNKMPVVQKVQTVQKPPVATQTKPVNTKVQAPQIPKPPQQTVQKTVQPVQNTTQPNIQISNPEELKLYKKALRNKIASNINFLSIAGDGKCSLSFSLSPSGTLLNRKFISQSQNTSLNDAVYSAMLKVPSFKSPPSGYKNETLKLTVQITGGNFSVSLE